MSSHVNILVDTQRYATIADDARAVRRQVAELSAESRRSLTPLGTHLYPRSLTYEVQSDGSGTHVLLYGGDSNGRTVAVRATNYYAYLFVRAFDADDDAIERFVRALDEALMVVALQRRNGSIGFEASRAFAAGLARPIVSFDVVDAISLKVVGDDRGFNGNRSERFVQLFVYTPALVRSIRDLLEHTGASGGARVHNDAGGEAVATLLVDGVRGARARMAAAEPDTDVKGHVRGEKRRKLSEQQLIDASAVSRSLVANDPATNNNAANDSDDDDDSPWQDPNVDDSLFDAAAPDATASGADENAIVLRGRSAEALQRLMTMAGTYGDGYVSRVLSLDRGATAIQIYEADIDFVLRFMIDARFKPEQCVAIDGDMGPWSGRESGRATLNDVEFSCDWRALRLADDEARQNVVAPQICMSFDCEMETGTNSSGDHAFPRAETEKVLQIACVIFDPVHDRSIDRAVHRAFVLDTVLVDASSDDDASTVYSFANERDLLSAFSLFTRSLAPDMLTGYNIEGFDLPYLLDRAATLGSLDDMSSMCRRPGSVLRVRERAFQSSAHGTHVYKEVVGEGLWVWDLYQAFKRSTEHKLRSYSLEYVSNHFLNDRKEDVAYTMINQLQSSVTGRTKLLRYCRKDALLPARIIGELMMLIGNVEMVRECGVTMDMLCRRGLQVRLKSLLYRECRWEPIRHVFYTRTDAERLASIGSSYQGAHVETPVVGYHDETVITVDFSSLYPSIIVTGGMCVKTLVPAAEYEHRQRTFNFDDDDVLRVDVDAGNAVAGEPVFLRSAHTRGLIPTIMQRLLASRKRVKRMMDEAERQSQDMLQAIYDKRQLAIKLNCNAIYGVFGAPSSFAYCQEIAASVTRWGRAIIIESKELIRRVFRIENGCPFNAEPIYGDTDSVFVKLHVPAGAKAPDGTPLRRVTIDESRVWGELIAAFVTDHFKRRFGDRDDNIIKLEFEKSYAKLIMYAKKRYVGWRWVLRFIKELGEKRMVRDSKPKASGMETERRDSCLLVSRGVREVLRILLSDDGDRVTNLRRVGQFIVDELVTPVETNTISWHELIQSKQFRMRPAEYTARGQTPPIHIQLAAKLDARLGAGSPGTYSPGDRVQYIVVSPNEPGQKTSECAEDPDYAWKRALPVSREHYVTNGIHSTMMRVLEPVLVPESAIAATAALVERSPDAVDEYMLEQVRKRRLEAENEYYRFVRSFRARRQHVAVDSAPATAGASAKTGLMAFATVKRRRCRLCGAVLSSTSTASTSVCDSHTDEELREFDDERTAKRRALDKTRDTLWRTCQACSQDWRAEDDPERAAALPPPPNREVTLEEATTCGTASCDKYWERRLSDRLA